jgi:hypothetical protein
VRVSIGIGLPFTPTSASREAAMHRGFVGAEWQCYAQNGSFRVNRVYHFTCAARLPWIVASGELRPGRNQLGKYPDPDFLWATTNPRGDRTASAFAAYRSGDLALVRLTLPEEDFEPWPEITARYPQWTPEQISRLETAALNRGESDFACWRARIEPLPLSRVIKSEAKTYTGTWQPIELVCLINSDPRVRAIALNDVVYCSAQCIQAGRPTKYAIRKLSLAEWQRNAVIAVSS